jgi:hypothetical protein
MEVLVNFGVGCKNVSLGFYGRCCSDGGVLGVKTRKTIILGLKMFSHPYFWQEDKSYHHQSRLVKLVTVVQQTIDHYFAD